jgi:hypothetical protein
LLLGNSNCLLRGRLPDYMSWFHTGSINRGCQLMHVAPIHRGLAQNSRDTPTMFAHLGCDIQFVCRETYPSFALSNLK